MYGLPPDMDLDFLCGCELIQICVGANECILNFHPDLSILITSQIGYLNSGGEYKRFIHFPDAVASISVLLGQQISAVTGHPDGTLRLFFASNARLDLFDDSKQFESYVIKGKGQLIVV